MNAPNTHIIYLLQQLPKGQRRAVKALFGQDKAITYKAAAESIGIGVGTIYTHVKRIRLNSPEIYKILMIYRKNQLEVRHQEALVRRDEHDHRFFSNRLKGWHNSLRLAGASNLISRRMSYKDSMSYIRGYYGI